MSARNVSASAELRGAHPDDDHVELALSDTGSGIAPDIIKKIFDPFFTTKEVGRGSGQGLAIAWSTVTKAHGGELRFDTKLNEGTTFYLRIPIDGPPLET